MLNIEKIEQALLSLATHEKSEINITLNNCHTDYTSVKDAIAENLYDINNHWINEETKKHAGETDKMWRLSVSYDEEDGSIKSLWNRSAQSLEEVLEEVSALSRDKSGQLIAALESELIKGVTGQFGTLTIRYDFVSDYHNDYAETVQKFRLKSDKNEGMLWTIIVYPDNPISSYRVSGLSLSEALNNLGLGPLVQHYEIQTSLPEKTDKTNKAKL